MAAVSLIRDIVSFFKFRNVDSASLKLTNKHCVALLRISNLRRFMRVIVNNCKHLLLGNALDKINESFFHVIDMKNGFLPASLRNQHHTVLLHSNQAYILLSSHTLYNIYCKVDYLKR